MPSRKPITRMSCFGALVLAYGFFAPQPLALAPRALAASIEDVPDSVACSPSRCADATAAEHYLIAVSEKLQQLASGLTSPEKPNISAEVAKLNARHCAERVGILAKQDSYTLPVAFDSVAASCKMAIAALRQAYRDAE